ncbi:PAS domain-containing protein [Methanogenium cariaci]|jgi:PAS domain S-box-containing protein
MRKTELQENADGPDDWLPPDTSTKGLWERTSDVIAEPALFFNADGTVFWANPASLSFFGVDADDLLGRHCYEMVRRFGLNFSDCPYERILKNKSQESVMMEYDNTWHINRLTPVLGADGEFQGMISHIRDGGDHVRLQEKTEQLNHLVAATDNAVVVTGPDHTIVRWNKGAERIFGYPTKDLSGVGIHELVPLASREIFGEYVDRVAAGESMVQFTVQGLKKSGEVMDLVVSLAPLHDPAGTVSGMIAHSCDVTWEHDVDMRLVQHLADTVVKITVPLSQMRSNLEETVSAMQDGSLPTEELMIFFSLQMKALSYIEENIAELNQVAIDGIDAVPDAFRKYLSR